MSNVIGFLEKMGQDAELRHATNGEMELALAATAIEPELQVAILSSDQSEMEALLGTRTNLICGLAPGKDDDDDEIPVEDDDEISSSLFIPRRVA